MGFIERVAELLASIPQTQERPSEVKRADTPRPNRVEPGASSIGRLFDPPENMGLGVETKARPARPARATTRAVSIDLEGLRRQHMISPGGGRTPIAESFRRIKRHILRSVANPNAGVPANLVMVTSSLPGEGKTFCAINLAISIALEMDHTVLLVDADVAKPSVPEILGFKAQKGLMDVLLDRNIDLADVMCKTNIDKLSLLPAGEANQHATELLASDAMRLLLREMAARYRDRILIFDSPPLLAASEAGALAHQMGQIVMVVEAGRTTEGVLKDALSQIESSKVAGLVLNKGGRAAGLLRFLYGGYTYGYGDYGIGAK